jgi:hypothetical protein
MKLWLIKQDANRGYDTFDSAIVAAETELFARCIHPHGELWNWEWEQGIYGCWAELPDQVTATQIGDATEGTPPGVILASFNAG